MDSREVWQKDSEYWSVYRDAMRLQASCEKAGMDVYAERAHDTRNAAFLRLVALHAADLTTPPDEAAA